MTVEMRNEYPDGIGTERCVVCGAKRRCVGAAEMTDTLAALLPAVVQTLRIMCQQPELFAYVRATSQDCKSADDGHVCEVCALADRLDAALAEQQAQPQQKSSTFDESRSPQAVYWPNVELNIPTDPKATATAIVKMDEPKNDQSDSLGLSVDMLDVDFLRRLAHGGAGTRCLDLADHLEQAIRDIGTLRAELDRLKQLHKP